MLTHRVLLLGCGAVGSATARLLAADETFDHVLAVDRDMARTRQIVEELGSKVTPIQADVYDETAVARLAQNASVVLNTTGPFTERVSAPIRGALTAGVPYADVNDEATVLWALYDSEELDTAARQRGVACVPGLGTSPGLTNIWARYLADQLDSVTAFHIAIAMDPRYRNPIVFQHRFSAHGGQAIVFRQGDWHWLPAFSEEESIRFPAPIGRVQVHLAAHCEPVTLPRFFKALQEVDMKAGFIVNNANHLLHDVIRYGLTTTEPVRVGASDVIPAEFTSAFLASPAADHLFQYEQLPTQIARQVQATGNKDGRPCTLTLQVVMDSGAEAIAMPLAVTARLLVLGQIPQTGLLAPEALPPRPFLDVLESWGVRLYIRREECTDRFIHQEADRVDGTGPR